MLVFVLHVHLCPTECVLVFMSEVDLLCIDNLTRILRSASPLSLYGCKCDVWFSMWSVVKKDKCVSFLCAKGFVYLHMHVVKHECLFVSFVAGGFGSSVVHCCNFVTLGLSV